MIFSENTGIPFIKKKKRKKKRKKEAYTRSFYNKFSIFFFLSFFPFNLLLKAKSKNNLKRAYKMIESLFFSINLLEIMAPSP